MQDGRIDLAMRNGLLVVISMLMSYLLFEVGLYLALCFGLAVPIHPYYNYSAWTNPHFIVADPVIGIRLQPNQPNDGIRVIQGDVQFYYPNIKANSAGFYSDHEYFPKKQRPYRIVVYGSSFAAMIYQNGTWVDHLHHLVENRGVEVYNFSFDGAGLANWHAHYFRELTAKYDFDMVVFVVAPGDILSPFAMSETRTDGYFINTFSEPPRDVEDIDRNYRPKLWRVLGMADQRFLTKLNDHFTRNSFLILPFDLYAFKSLRLMIFGNQTGLAPAEKPKVDGAKLRGMFLEMLSDIRARGKQAVLVALPSDPSLIFQKPNSDVEHLRALGEDSCSRFVDGNELFRVSTRAEQIRSYWPQYEAHWFKRGGDRFAELLAPDLMHALELGVPSSKSCQ
jgi:hypothetical protein